MFTGVVVISRALHSLYRLTFPSDITFCLPEGLSSTFSERSVGDGIFQPCMLGKGFVLPLFLKDIFIGYRNAS